MSNVKKNSIEIISKHFGQRIAELYKANFEDKRDDVVLVIMQELLVDYLGEDQAQKEISEISNLSNQNEE